MKSPDHALSWYEASLPLKERKRRGHFSTPPLLVERVLDACGYLPDADLARIRVLDPACGGGNFLAAAARRLLAFAGLRELDRAAQIALAQRNLWGFDPDPVACFQAEMQLRTIMEEAWQGLAWHSQETPLSECALQVHQADGLTLPWEPRVDLFVANPPYLAAKNTDLSGYQSAQQRGQADSYLLFLNCALQVVRPGGWIGMVLPDPVLARANAARERTYLLKDATIRHIWHLSGVFTAEVGAVVIIAQKCPPPPVHYVSWIRGKWQRNTGHQLIAPRAGSDKTNYGVVGPRFIEGPRFITPDQYNTSSGYQMGTVPQSLFLKQPRAELRYLLGDKRGSIAEHLRSCLEEMHPPPSRLAPLSKFLSISRGEELGKESPYISPSPQPAYYPVLRGGIDIQQYKAPIGNWCIPREAISKPLERYLSPKLIVVKSTDCLQAALDTRGHITLQTLYLLHLRTEINVGARTCWINPHSTALALEADVLDDLYFFLALLNSRLLRDYVYMLHTAYKWVQPQIEQSVLARLPVPIVEAEERKGIIELSKLLVHACSAEDTVVEWKRPIRSIYEEQEHAIRTLYASVLPGLFTLSTKESKYMAETRPIRVLVAKPGLDGHDRGAKVIARALRDAGMEVIYTGIRQTPEMIVEAAIQEDVDAILMSILSGAHMAIFPKVMELLKQNDVHDVLVAAGGILPDEDIPAIKAMGIKGCFGPGTSTEEIIEFVRNNIQADRLKTEV